MVLDTTTEVDSISSVLDRDGAVLPAANADLQRAIANALANNVGASTLKLTPSTAGEQLPAASVASGSEVLLLADPANSGPILIGGDDPTLPLEKGRSITWNVGDISALSAKAMNATDVLHVAIETGDS